MKIYCLDVEMVVVFSYPARFQKPCRYVSLEISTRSKNDLAEMKIAYSKVNFSDKISFLKSWQ